MQILTAVDNDGKMVFQKKIVDGLEGVAVVNCNGYDSELIKKKVAVELTRHAFSEELVIDGNASLKYINNEILKLLGVGYEIKAPMFTFSIKKNVEQISILKLTETYLGGEVISE